MDPKVIRALESLGLKKGATQGEIDAFVAEKNINIVALEASTPDAGTDGAAERAAEIKEILALGKRFGMRDQAEKAVVDGTGLDEFRCAVIEHKGGQKAGTDSSIGLSEKEVRSYSLLKALRCLADNKPLSGFEREVSDEVGKKLKREAKGFFLPSEVTGRSMGSTLDVNTARARGLHANLVRALQATVATAGGYTVGEDVLGSSMIDLLRNLPLVAQLGATMLTGLQGNIAIPKQTGGATAYWVDETEEISASQQSFGSVGLRPHRLGAVTAYTKQLLAQASIDVEAFVRMDLMLVLAIAKDLAAINGSGANGEPLGILNTTGLNTVTFGAAPSWAKVVAFETAVEEDNVMIDGTAAYLTTAGVKGAWKVAEKATGTAKFLLEGGETNGYPLRNTQQVPSNKVLFGVWSNLIMADWDGIDVVVDPYTLAANGQIRIVPQLLTDVAVRHPEAFCASTDAGNQ